VAPSQDRPSIDMEQRKWLGRVQIIGKYDVLDQSDSGFKMREDARRRGFLPD